MSIFEFNDLEIYTFFAVFIRVSVLMAIMPFIGDKQIPKICKIVFPFLISVIIFPVLISKGFVDPNNSKIWSSSVLGILKTISIEVLFALCIGFTCRVFFDVLSIGGNIFGQLMGLGAASQFDPTSESQTQVLGRIKLVLGMLIFITINGHHLMIRSLYNSFKFVGIGQAHFSERYIEQLTSIVTSVMRIGFQLAGPMVVTFILLNIFYGVMAKAIPQLNILILSFSISSFIGFFVLHSSIPEFGNLMGGWFMGMENRITQVMVSLR